MSGDSRVRASALRSRPIGFEGRLAAVAALPATPQADDVEEGVRLGMEALDFLVLTSDRSCQN